MARIDISIYVAAPPARCFDLARSVEFHMHATARTGERARLGRTTGLMRAGEDVTWSARHLGVWQDLTSRITAFDRPTHVRDSMERGALARFEHDHVFVIEGSGTRRCDVFDCAAPLGPLGRRAEWGFLTANMRRFLQCRSEEIRAAAESDEWRRFVPDGP